MKTATLFLTACLFSIACTNAAKPPVAVQNTPTPRPAASQPAGGHDHGSEPHAAERISLAAAKKDFDAKNAVFIDTHTPEQYAQRHIPGAINVPANDIEPYLNKIPKGKKIIAYCS
ncbi:MAG TPA: rhodanese-like domain-containing protein [Pyrinomonadaceae bacterium]|nr:rhodanese-like domain-containing protein [Pyrinomonadaceae bacterium]